MSGFVQRVRERVDDGCIAKGISKEGCGVSLDGAPASRVIIDLDAPGSPLPPPNRRCDYLVVVEESSGAGRLAPMELSSSRFQVGKFVEQLRSGSRAAEHIVPAGVAVNFRPIAVYGGSIHKADWTRLRRRHNKVSFRGMRETPRLLKCGSRLTQALR